jgi:hypothetical protein
LLLQYLQKHAAANGVSREACNSYSHTQAKTVFANAKDQTMNAFDHMLNSHLRDFPRIYALSAKQKRTSFLHHAHLA